MTRQRLVLWLALAGFGMLLVAGPAGAAAPLVNTEPGTWEVGVLLGEPTGFSAKYWTTYNSAFDIGAAWSFEGSGQFHLHADYLFHNFDAIKVSDGSLPLYFGIGGRIRFDENDVRVGMRIAVGAEYIFARYPMSLFFEIAPIVDFTPETEASVNGGIGIRYVF